MKPTLPFKRSLTLAISGMFIAGLLCAPAVAQTVPPGGTNLRQADPGLIQRRAEEDIENQKEKIPEDAEKTPEVKLNVEKAPANVEISTTKFHVDTINIESATIISEQELDEITRPYEGKEITLADLEAIVNAITQKYRDKGYLTSQAYVPPQEVDKGLVSIKVVEGKVGKLCITGNRYYRPGVFKRNLTIKPGEPFNLKALERSLNRSNQQNNFFMRAILSPGAETGETDVKVEAQERAPWQITPTFDNQGRPFVGYNRGGVEITNDSLFGYGDRMVTKFLGADGTFVGLGSYSVPINRNGDDISVNYGYSRVNLEDDEFAGADIDGTAKTLGFVYTHPFDDERVWVGDVGVYGRKVYTEFFNQRDDESLNEIRAVQAGLSFNKPDRLGRTFARLQTTGGLDILGGSSRFFKAEGYLTRLFRMPMNNVLMVRFYGQWSPDALPSAEAIQIGGAYSVRGFTEGVIIGDRGYNLSIEDRWPIPFLSRVSPWLADRLQGAVFFDIGQAFNDQSGDGPGGRFIQTVSRQSENTLLVGTGIGLRARLTQYLQGFLDVGFGLVDRDNVEPKGYPTARVHFGVRSNLLPEAYKPPRKDTKPTCDLPPGRTETQPEPQAVNPQPQGNGQTNIVN